MDDLDDFMSEVEHNDNVQMPKQFDDVVDIVVDDEREKGEQIQDVKDAFGEDSKQFEEAMADLAADDANPFWKRLLQPDKAYGIDLNKEIAPVIQEALDTGMVKTAGKLGQILSQGNTDQLAAA